MNSDHTSTTARSTFYHFFPHCNSLVKKATYCQVSTAKNERQDTGYNTSKIKGFEEVDEFVGFCGKQCQK